MTRKRKKAVDHVQSAYYDPFMNNPVRNKQATVERMYVRILTELSCNRFKWANLPVEVDERFLELTLFRQALVVFFKDTKEVVSSANNQSLGKRIAATDRFFAMRGTGYGVVNMYDNPTKFRVLGNGHMERDIDARHCVPIWSNYLRIPDWDIVTVYAAKLAHIDRTIEINLNAMRYTHIITTSENKRLTWQNIMRQHDEGQPMIFGVEDLDMTSVNAFPVTIEKDVVLNLQLVKAKLWNECMTLLGINNANQDKKERLISGEVDANNGQVMASRSVALTARQQAAEQINRMFPDLNVSVEWNAEQSVPEAPSPLEIKAY